MSSLWRSHYFNWEIKLVGTADRLNVVYVSYGLWFWIRFKSILESCLFYFLYIVVMIILKFKIISGPQKKNSTPELW